MLTLTSIFGLLCLIQVEPIHLSYLATAMKPMKTSKFKLYGDSGWAVLVWVGAPRTLVLWWLIQGLGLWRGAGRAIRWLWSMLVDSPLRETRYGFIGGWNLECCSGRTKTKDHDLSPVREDISSVLLLWEGYCVREFLGVWDCEFLCLKWFRFRFWLFYWNVMDSLIQCVWAICIAVGSIY